MVAVYYLLWYTYSILCKIKFQRYILEYVDKGVHGLSGFIKLSCLFLVLILILSSGLFVFAEEEPENPAYFSDVPQNSYAFDDINSLRSLGITNGIGENKFGYGNTISRADFLTFLIRLMGWELLTPAKGSFSDNQDTGKHYYNKIETAFAHGVIKKDSDSFRPSDPITREEMAVMIVRCLEYDALSTRLDYLPKPFPDVSENSGYITIARDLGIINGVGTGFSPKGTALKEQAAAMMMRMYRRLNAPIDSLNAFYAISSNSQKDLITSFSSICFGWSRLTYDDATGEIILNSDRDGSAFQEYSVPEDFSERITTARQNNIPALLMIYASQETRITDLQSNNSVGLLEYLLAKPDAYGKLISDLSDKIENTSRGSETGSFDGVVIDFECMKGELLKNSFNIFLKELRDKLGPDKKIYVTVPPVMSRSQPCFDAYDYRTIGEIADKVILMAHDYSAKSLTESDMLRGAVITPLTPAEEVYHALRSITDINDGVQDKSRIMLQISFNWVGWRKTDGKTLNSIPDYYSLDNFLKLFESSPSLQYSDLYKNPYLKFTDASGVERTVWYEDSRSVLEKIKMAKMFGVTGISIWRLGNIPDIKTDNYDLPFMDIWDNILKAYRKI